ncbi:Pvc16 family protein [Aquimarina sp. RZ0]|uniref:Pvc16 family protein n=1 Tax=Aquimarina sp. RZ0 TaxID=2607730 RepID=UPI0011F29C0E|nr:Pvc16 family protein [Aquimarina sp. RZ0]KAA1248060.1 DUF4255 domain-containing protein [Aquimarina sp. RZ0]
MLKDFLNHIGSDLDDYINALSSITTVVKTDIANIGDFGTNSFSGTAGANLFITIVKTEEESTLRNFPNSKLVQQSNGDYAVDKRFPKIHLNYFLLFSATVSYDMSIAAIHRIIKYFQTHKTFQFTSDESEIELTLELVSPSFEQINHMWGTLGGKQFPHVLYKARVSEHEFAEEQLSPVIKTITGTLK